MKKNIIFRVSLISIIAVLVIGFTVAYYTDNESHTNSFGVGINQILVELQEIYVPPNKNDFVPGGHTSYQKEIWAKNTGEIDTYIRIGVNFSDGRAENESYFSNDGTNWYKATEYKDHLPEGWVYVDEDELGGPYYYYTQKVTPNQETPTLFKKVWTDFDPDEEALPYDIFVYAEAVQTIDNQGRELTDSTSGGTTTYAAVETWRSLMNI